ncbi:S-adenosyl-L-methionine-dependent methyltransferase [Mycena galericulata]|nr:S-adenosyl-L-methionine-dependent methyltransferase [Mycena galericulata]
MPILRASLGRKIRFRWPFHTGGPRHSRRLLSNTSISPTITSVEKIIMDGIKATGPISFSTYMQLCLSHPTEGYYMNPQNPIFGAKGDFVTSPEISSVFGELLGVWLLAQWMRTVKQLRIRLVELGPGRGTLMHDVLRVAGQFGGNKLRSVHLVETSPALRALQETRLAPTAATYGATLEWHDSIEQIPVDPRMYTMVIAHEFFDALPFHTIEKTEQGWQEILIALAESESTKEIAATPSESGAEKEDAGTNPRFRYVLAPQPTAASNLLGISSPRFKDLPVGSRLEVSPVAFKTMRALGRLICGKRDVSPSRGCALIVDYGASRAFNQSFRAFKDHKIVDVLHAPGQCDLTANVDFAYLAEAVKDLLTPQGPLPQSAFLEKMGLQARTEFLVSTAQTDETKAAIREAARRLVDPAGMGSEYMVLGMGGQPERGVVWPFDV